MASSPFKPAWLESFQAYLRAHQVTRACFWAVSCFVLFAGYLWLTGRPPTMRNLLIELVSWSVAGVFFYLFMRWWDANHAR